MTHPMKKTIFALVCILLALSSCQKKGVNLFVGDYSFKTSGEVSISAETEVEENDLPIPASLNIDLSNEIGQLNISAADKSNNQVIVVINYTNGDVITTTGTCNGKTITLDEFKRNILPVSISTLLTNSNDIKVGGTGTMYDEDMIVFDMDYSGKVAIGSVTFKINDRDVRMVAYRN